jgi:hypothetical protein
MYIRCVASSERVASEMPTNHPSLERGVGRPVGHRRQTFVRARGSTTTLPDGAAARRISRGCRCRRRRVEGARFTDRKAMLQTFGDVHDECAVGRWHCTSPDGDVVVERKIEKQRVASSVSCANDRRELIVCMRD